MHKICVCISGTGSNLQALIEAVKSKELECEIGLVVSNRLNVQGISRAEQASIPTHTQTSASYKKQGKSRIEFDMDLAHAIKKKFNDQSPSLIVLAGFMHILSKDFLDQFPPNSVINLHPALPGCYDGAKAIERAYQDFKDKKVNFTGVMIHRCIPEVDRGTVIVKEVCPIKEGDSLSDLEARIHEIEHRLIVQGVELALMLIDSEILANE